MYRITKNLPIGVYDSGIGGLCVMKELCDAFPYESFVYFGDNGNAPYGSKSLEELKTLSTIAIKKLKRKKIKALVLACNTISTNLYEYIKDTSALITIKTTPPSSTDKYDCLLCTPLTASSVEIKENFNGTVIACKDLANDIERNVFCLNKIDLNLIVSRIPSNASRVVLGCTHYFYIKKQLEGFINAEVSSNFNKVKEELIFSLKNNFLLKNNGKQKVTYIGKFRKKNKKVYEKILAKTIKWSKK